MNKITTILLGASLLVAAGGCEEPGPAERAGERLDNAVEDARGTAEDLGDELRSAGDEVGDTIREGMDEVEDAVDEVDEEI